MRDKIVLISKDVLRADYLPVYGNRYWRTPNIDELARKGTVFRRHYAAAPSSAMAYTCMFSGLNAHELDRKSYTEVGEFRQAPTLFNILKEKGYSCHVIWEERWNKFAYPYTKCYGDDTVFHSLKIGEMLGPHKIHYEEAGNEEREKTVERIAAEVDLIKKNKIFLWIHLPHVLLGRKAYGSDIDLLDLLVGKIRERFSDESIYLTADHGHMNFGKGVVVYGFHVYEGAIRIPLITPRINNTKEVLFPTSSIQMKEIILENKISKPDYVFSDTQYYAQPLRKLAVIKDEYKYIFNKRDGSEELYDCQWDENENLNLLKDSWFDRERHRWYPVEEVSFYPYYEKAREYYRLLKAKKDEIWKDGTFIEEKLNLFKHRFKLMSAKAKGLGRGSGR